MDGDVAKVVDLDYIDIHDVRWNKDLGYLQITFRIGYVDSNGKFKAASQYPAHEFAIERGREPEKWQKHEAKIEAIIAQLEEILHAESGVAQAAIVAWGLPNVESVVE
jgi:hypothetical protein